MPKFVMFCGLAGAGKDTFAGYVAEHLRGSHTLDCFAAPLHTAAIGAFGAGWTLDRALKETQVDLWESRATEAVHQCLVEVGATHDEVDTGMGYWKAVAGEYLTKKHRLLISPREFMQKLGTEICRRVRESIFLDSIKERNKDSGIVLVTDCRFENELALADEAHLIRGPQPIKEPKHVSEVMATQMLLTVPYGSFSGHNIKVVNNVYSLNYLYNQAGKLAKELEAV